MKYELYYYYFVYFADFPFLFCFILFSLLVRKAQRALGTTLEEDEDEDSVI